MFMLSPLALGLGILAFLAAVRLSANISLGKIWCSATAVLVPYLVILMQRFVYLTGVDLPLVGNLITLRDVITVSLQFICALVIFRLLEEYEANIPLWIGTIAVGILLVVVAIPMGIVQILSP